MRVYYAHCISLYGTLQEKRDVETLESLGFEVSNPNDPEIERRVNELKSVGHDTEAIMHIVFRATVAMSDAVAFRSVPGGGITLGVAREVEWAREFGKPVIELPEGILRRRLTLDETREFLREVGHR